MARFVLTIGGKDEHIGSARGREIMASISFLSVVSAEGLRYDRKAL